MRLSPIHHTLIAVHFCEFAGGTRFRMWLRKGVLYSAICANYRLPQKDRRKGRSTLDGQAGFFWSRKKKIGSPVLMSQLESGIFISVGFGDINLSPLSLCFFIFSLLVLALVQRDMIT
jgi:hypothetical protein